MSIRVTVFVQKEENWYVAKCVENSVASQGKTIEESLANLKEALELYYEDAPFSASDFRDFLSPFYLSRLSNILTGSRFLTNAG